jgi:hypothetical protein
VYTLLLSEGKLIFKNSFNIKCMLSHVILDLGDTHGHTEPSSGDPTPSRFPRMSSSLSRD